MFRCVAVVVGHRLSRQKTPKAHFLDSGLLSSLIGLTDAVVSRDRIRLGPALESYVFGELLKLASWSDDYYDIYTYRDKDQIEVDFVVESQTGDVVGVEVKAAASLSRNDFAGLRRLANLAGSSSGLYDGEHDASHGRPPGAAPVSTPA